MEQEAGTLAVVDQERKAYAAERRRWYVFSSERLSVPGRRARTGRGAGWERGAYTLRNLRLRQAYYHSDTT